jgi:signal peptidase I
MLNSKLKPLLKEIQTIAIIVFGVFFFKSFLYEPYRIPSGSMVPTLVTGDFIIVNKFAYGFKIPFSDLTIGKLINLNPIYISEKTYPVRGDVIVFKFPSDPETSFIKRVIGIPGDEIEIRNKKLFLNNVELKTNELKNDEMYRGIDDKFKGTNFKLIEEELENKKHIVQIDRDNFYKANFKKIKIPAGKYFMMGDNRDNSFDSRDWGLISFEHIKGKAVGIWLSVVLPFGDDHFKLQLSRIGKMIY